MTVTEAAPQAEAKVETKSTWWTARGSRGKEYLTALDANPDGVYEQVPAEDIPQGYSDYLWVYAGVGNGYVYDMKRSRTQRWMFHLTPRDAFKTTKEPPIEQQVPGEVVALSEDEAKKQLYLLQLRQERAVKALHAHAKRKGMCSTFDDIMELAGWPARPRPIQLLLEYELQKQEVTPEDAGNYLRNGWTLPAGTTLRLRKVKQAWLTTPKGIEITEVPEAGTNALEYLAKFEYNEAKLRQWLRDNVDYYQDWTKEVLASITIANWQWPNTY